MTRTQGGFTIVEVLIAIVILSAGILALASSGALITRMIAQGQRYSQAAELANKRFETLRSSSCSALASSGSATSGQFREAWTVTTVGSGGRRFTVVIQSPTGTGTRTDTFSTVRFC